MRRRQHSSSAKVFFPEFSSTAGTLAAFGTFAVGFAARPIGAVIFGHYGDRLGRRTTLIVSLLVMGVATVAVGLIPSYDSIGIAAPLLLVILRFLQGLALGGEWTGAVLLATEYAPKGKRGLYSAFPQIGPAVAFIMANGLFLVLNALICLGATAMLKDTNDDDFTDGMSEEVERVAATSGSRTGS